MSAPAPGRNGSAVLLRTYYRFLLLAYPPEFRAAHGEDVTDVFIDLARATRRRGLLPFLGLWLRSLPEVAGGGFDERRGSRPQPPKRRLTGLDVLARELRQATRALVRRPGFALTAILTLALGIAATSAVFSVVDTVLLRPLPFPRPQELIVVNHVVPEIATSEWGLSRGGYFYFRERAATLQDIAVYRDISLVLTGDGPPERLPSALVTWSLLTTLGVNPEIGRPFTIDDDLPSSAPVVILSHALWTRSFGADAAVLGSSVTLTGTAHEVIGVMPRSFRFPAPDTGAWIPARLDPSAQPINQHIYDGLARMRAGVGIEQTTTELDALVARFADDMPTAYGNGFVESSGFAVVTRELLEDTVGNVRLLLWVVLAAAGLVLIIACSNVANLTMLRSEGRRREVAVRTALGASRWALLRYSLSEALVLAVAGGVFGVALAWAGVRLLVLAAPADLSRVDEIAMRPLAVLVALASVAAVAVILGTVSALRGKARLADQLKGAGRSGSSDRQRIRIRGAFVVTQVSMAVLLMVGSGVLLRSFANLRAVDPGFDPDNVLTLHLSVSPTKYEDNSAAVRFFEQVGDRLRALPGVIAVGAVTGLPLVSRANDNINGVADLPDGTETQALMDTKFAGPGYFEALGMRLVEGRTFERRDTVTESPGAIVTRSLAQQFWPGESAVGKRVKPLLTEFPWHTIVGVVDDVRIEDIRRGSEPTVYFPTADLAWSRSFYFAVRTDGSPAALVPAVRREVWALDPDVPIASVATMNELVSDHFSRTSFTLTLVGAAAVMALFLCAVGIYGVIAYSVTQRHFEIGVRMALGAQAGQVAGMVFRQTMLLAATGIVVGLGLAFVGMGLMESLLYEVAPTDPSTLAAVAIGLVLVAGLAGALPARRATRVDAIVALQGD